MKRNVKTEYFILTIILNFIAISCTTKEVTSSKNTPKEEVKSIITLTPAQAKSIDLQVGEAQKKNMGASIKVNGMVDLPPSSKALVSSQVEGFVKYLNILNGEYVQKGQLLTQLQHFNYLQLQENYLTICSETAFLEKELERQQLLAKENINALKSLQKTQTDFEINKAKKASLEAQLQLLGFNPSQIKPQNLSSVINIVSPVSGYVKAVHINLGKNVLPNTVMFEINNMAHKHLELNVFEKDILKVKEKQKITFQIPSLGNDEYDAEVYLIGKTFDPQTKTVGIHAHFEKEHEEKFLEGMFVNAKIWVETTPTEVLPEEAIVKEGDFSFAFIETKPYTYQKVALKAQKAVGGFVAFNLLDKTPPNPKFVIKGAYYLQSQLMNVGEEE